MKSKILITTDISRPFQNRAKQSNLTPDELAEMLIKKQLKLK